MIMNYVPSSVFSFPVVEYLSGSDRHFLVPYPATPGEVALRMAMGANRKNIFYRLITESLLLLSMSALPAALIAFNIGYTELVDISQMALQYPVS